MVKRTCEGHLVQHYYSKHSHLEQVAETPTTCLGHVSMFGRSYRKKSFFLYLNGISCSPVCSHCLLSCPWASLRRDQLHFLYSCPSGIYFDKILTKPSLLEIKQFQLPQPVFIVFTTSKGFSKEIKKCNQSSNWLQEKAIISRNLRMLSRNSVRLATHVTKMLWSLMMKKQIKVIYHFVWQIWSALGLPKNYWVVITWHQMQHPLESKNGLFRPSPRYEALTVSTLVCEWIIMLCLAVERSNFLSEACS